VSDILTKSDLPLDTRLLSEAIYELNISRHNVSIYPRNHPIVEKSLGQAYSFLLKLFELRNEVTLAIAKDTLIIDDNYLDKKNPVYKDFATCLSQKSIAYLTFMSGLTKEELYSLHQFLLADIQNSSSDQIQNIINDYKFIHIKIGLVDYAAFHFTEGKLSPEESETSIWEKYVYGLLEGKLVTENTSMGIQEIKPSKLAAIINKFDIEAFKEESYDRVITSYVRKSMDTAFSVMELRTLLNFINGLKPELKRQFLSSVVGNIAGDMESAQKALKEMSLDEVINLLDHINEQMIVIPDTLKNVLDKFAHINHEKVDQTSYGSGLIEDDILLSSEITSLLSEANFGAFVSETYQGEILQLLKYDSKQTIGDQLKDFDHEWKDEEIETVFSLALLEVLSPEREDILSPEDYVAFVDILKEQAIQLIDTCQYKEVLKIIKVLESNIAKDDCPDEASTHMQYFYSKDFIGSIIDSFSVMGKQQRGDVIPLTNHYGAQMIPYLMDSLIDEESPTARRFILSLLTGFSEKVIPETLERLEDDRWFVKRNMLFILMDCGNEEDLKKARPYCSHDNPKVSFEAIKCLLKAGDNYGVKAIRKYMQDESTDLVNKAIMLAGAYKVKDLVPELIQMLKKKSLSGNDFEAKIPVVKALGLINDPRAVDALKGMLSARSFLYKGALENLKGEIKKSLKNYSRKDS
jgi:hypothetical protein